MARDGSRSEAPGQCRAALGHGCWREGATGHDESLGLMAQLREILSKYPSGWPARRGTSVRGDLDHLVRGQAGSVRRSGVVGVGRAEPQDEVGSPRLASMAQVLRVSATSTAALSGRTVRSSSVAVNHVALSASPPRSQPNGESSSPYRIA